MKKSSLLFLFLCLIACRYQKGKSVYESENLKIKQLSEHTYLHVSFLNTEDYGKVACNGMIVENEGQVLVFDTPVNDQDSKELIHWIKNNLNGEIKGIIATHFHSDCLGGLNEFHAQGIPSYANHQTIEFAKLNNTAIPKNGFDRYFELDIGTKIVVNEFLGEGHTKDNIISYFPNDKVLFGGCLIKSEGAGKGNLEDANTKAWSSTVSRIKSSYKDARIIIPGHGNPGSQELLNYTINLFDTN